jgi:hypothetical protein
MAKQQSEGEFFVLSGSSRKMDSLGFDRGIEVMPPIAANAGEAF